MTNVHCEHCGLPVWFDRLKLKWATLTNRNWCDNAPGPFHRHSPVYPESNNG